MAVLDRFYCNSGVLIMEDVLITEVLLYLLFGPTHLLLSSMLEHLRSLWRKFFEWQYCRASTSCRVRL